MLQGQGRVQANRTRATRENPLDQKQPVDTPGARCSRHDSVRAHDGASSGDRIRVDGEEERYEHAVVAAIIRAVLPHNAARRAFFKSVGTATAMAALGPFFPLKATTELLAQGRGALEKKKLKVGFIPITCATPIIMAHPMGFYAKHGLDVEVIKTAGWAVVRDKTLNKEYDDTVKGIGCCPHAGPHADSDFARGAVVRAHTIVAAASAPRGVDGLLLIERVFASCHSSICLHAPLPLEHFLIRLSSSWSGPEPRCACAAGTPLPRHPRLSSAQRRGCVGQAQGQGRA